LDLLKTNYCESICQVPIVGSNQPQRLARLADAFKVTIDRETWFELWTLACGQEVP